MVGAIYRMLNLVNNPTLFPVRIVTNEYKKWQNSNVSREMRKVVFSDVVKELNFV